MGEPAQPIETNVVVRGDRLGLSSVHEDDDWEDHNGYDVDREEEREPRVPVAPVLKDMSRQRQSEIEKKHANDELDLLTDKLCDKLASRWEARKLTM